MNNDCRKDKGEQVIGKRIFDCRLLGRGWANLHWQLPEQRSELQIRDFMQQVVVLSEFTAFQQVIHIPVVTDLSFCFQHPHVFGVL